MIEIKGLEECVHLVATPGPHAPYLILGGGQLTSQFKNISEQFFVRANECSIAFLKVSTPPAKKTEPSNLVLRAQDHKKNPKFKVWQ